MFFPFYSTYFLFTVVNLLIDMSSTVYHPARYNTSLDMRNDCARSPCSHLCLAVPAGRRCACPDLLPPPKRATHAPACDAAAEPPRPLPRVCPCRNGGTCSEDDAGELTCACLAPLLPPFCAEAAAATRGPSAGAVLVPVLLVLVLAAAAAAAWFVIRKRPL